MALALLKMMEEIVPLSFFLNLMVNGENVPILSVRREILISHASVDVLI